MRENYVPVRGFPHPSNRSPLPPPRHERRRRVGPGSRWASGCLAGLPDELVGPPMRAQATVRIMTSADDTGLLGKEPTVASEPLIRAGLKVDVEPTGGAA